MLDTADKDFKIVAISMFKELKEPMFKELKKSMMTMTHKYKISIKRNYLEEEEGKEEGRRIKWKSWSWKVQ